MFSSARHPATRGLTNTAAAGKALISVSDKAKIVELGKALQARNIDIVSTGGSARALADGGITVMSVEELTGFPEMLDGRVKTLHPRIHGGILARRDVPSHTAALKEHSIASIDIVVVNLYPFRKTVTTAPPPAFEDGVENIDIGGPALLRAAAKNHADVTVVVDPEDYEPMVAALDAGGDEASAFRRRCAWKAFQHCASYDAIVAEWLWARSGEPAPPPSILLPLRCVAPLRYGENPHQRAALFEDLSLAASSSDAPLTQLHGKEMSFNNYLDTGAAYAAVSEFPSPACVIVKHTNPCGAAVSRVGSSDLREAYRASVRADPISAFGGIVAFNRDVDEALARELREFRSPTDGETRMFYEIVVAPGYSPEGLAVLKGKSKALRILEAPLRRAGTSELRQTIGGWLWQSADDVKAEDVDFTVVSEAVPTAEQMDDLRLAWRVVKHVKSNAITIAKGGRLLGMGSGQPNRVKSCQIALDKAAGEAPGAVLASDAFFPFSWGDSVELACQAGIKAIAHPGGSIRDEDAVACCNKYQVALVTTGVRHFRH